MYGACANIMRFTFPQLFDFKSFKRLPKTPEWTRFRKYARRMQELGGWGDSGVQPSSEVLSVLQLCTAKKPLFPNLKTLELCQVTGDFIPFIPLFLSPRTTTIDIMFDESDLPKAAVASMIAALPTLCPDLQGIHLQELPRDPMITAAVSEMLLATNQNTLRSVDVDSSLTQEAREMIFKLPNLNELVMTTERETSLPSVVLPNLTNLTIQCGEDSDWLQIFHGATFEKLERVTFSSKSEPIGDFLEAFERVALAASAQNTLSAFLLYVSRPWRPKYRSLLPFTQLKEIYIGFSCTHGCSSTIDDGIITDIARTMPRIKMLRLGKAPCPTPTGVTAKGLAALAYYCLHLSTLRVHFQVTSLHPPAIFGVTSSDGPSTSREDCALTNLEVGKMPLSGESTLMVALTLLRIFPRIRNIVYLDKRWRRVADAISLSGELLDQSSKKLSLPRP